MEKTSRPAWMRYGIALLAVGVACGLRALLTPLLANGNPFLLLYPAIVVAAWFGGLGPGLLATALGAIVADYLYLDDARNLLPRALRSAVPVSIFLLSGAMVSILSELLHKACRRAETASAGLRESEQRCRTLFESMDEGSCVIEVIFDDRNRPTDYRFLEINPAFEKQTGIENARGRSMKEIAPNHERHWFEIYGRIALTGETLRFENEAAALGRWYDVCAFRVGPPELRRVGIVFNDITQRRRAEEEKEHLLRSERAARTEAENASRMKDEFLSTLSHELRTPLNAILGWASLLRKPRADAQDMQQGLETIERNARAQTAIIGDLLDMSRIISGKLRLDVQRVDLAGMIDAAISTVYPAADAKGVRVQKVLDPLSAPVFGDPARLQQVFWNLLSNSVKFTPRGGRVQVLLERVDSHVELTVSDTGIGIKPEFLPHVFERFRQEDGSTTRRHGGLGLGLSIVQSIVELHGGSVRVESPGEGKGATFVVALPLGILHREDEPPPRQHPKTTLVPSNPSETDGLSLRGVKVLVVDDELDACALIRRILRDREAEVLTAESGAEALGILQRERPGALLSDIGMPGMDGYEFIRRVRSLAPEEGGGIPAAALTAFARPEDRTRALLAGYQMHLSKPVEPFELTATVASLAGVTMQRHRAIGT